MRPLSLIILLTLIIFLITYLGSSVFFPEKLLKIKFDVNKRIVSPREKIYLEPSLVNYGFPITISHSDPLFLFEIEKDGELLFTYPNVILTVRIDATINLFKNYQDDKSIIKNKRYIFLNEPGVYKVTCIANFRFPGEEIDRSIKSNPIEIVVE